MASKTRLTRRRFLGASGALLAAPYFVPSTALGLDGTTAPSNKVTIGCIGLGWQGPYNMGQFLGIDECRVVAVCDLDENHLNGAVNSVNGKYGNKDVAKFHDFRELVARKDIDAVMIATPDHWHAIVAIAAANAGKDIWCEKPMCHTLVEQQAVVKAVQANKRIWQTGSWQRSVGNFRNGVGLVTNGYIGKIKRVEVGLPSGHSAFDRVDGNRPNSDPPKELDYEFWVGPSDMVPYTRSKSHKVWRWNYNFGGGQLMDWIGHHCDIAHWGLGNDDKIGPTELEATAVFPAKEANWNTATSYRITCKYPNDIEFIIGGGQKDIRGGTKWIGEDGWVHVDRGQFSASNKDWTKEAEATDRKDGWKNPPYKSNNHWLNFVQCIKSRKPTITPVEVAHHSATPGHLGYIASVTGRKIKWNAATEIIENDAEATALLGHKFREPWKL